MAATFAYIILVLKKLFNGLCDQLDEPKRNNLQLPYCSKKPYEI